MLEFIPASSYHPAYMILITLMTIIVYSQYQKINGLRDFKHNRNDAMCGVLILLLVFFIGLRPVSSRYFVDMIGYVLHYTIHLDGASFNFDKETDNILFDNLFRWWGAMRLGYTSFFVLIATIYFGTSYLGIRKIFPNHRIAAYLVFLAAFSTFSYGTNGIKAGAATSLFIWALGYRDNLMVCIPLVLLSWGFHHSMIMPVAAFVVTLFVKNPKVYFYGWFFCLLMAIGHVKVFAQFFSGFTTEHGAEYLLWDGKSGGFRGGFRPDFVLYSVMPVWVGWYVVIKKRIQISQRYNDLLCLYLCLNSLWMLCMHASFNNRIAYLSWFLYPIVLIYPYLQEPLGKYRYKMFGKIMLYHLGFTLFMFFVFYA